MPLRIDRSLASMALIALGAGAAELEYHDKFDSAVEAAEKNRQLVMVVVVAPVKDKEGRDLCKMFREETLPEEQMAKLIKRHFAPFLLDVGAVQAGKQAVPPVLQACFKPNEQISVPLAIFLDAKCKEVHRIAGYAPPAGYIGLLRKVLEKVAEAVPEKDRRDAQRALERGKKALDDKDFAAAMDALKALVDGGATPADADAAKELMNQVEAKASDALEAAEALEGKQKLGSAVRAYQECARGFKGTDAAAKAAARLVEIRKDPEVRKKLNNHMAASLLAKARQDAEQAKYPAAMEALDTLLKRYGDAEAAAEAKKLRERLEADPEIAGQVRDAKAKAEAERYLSLGDSFRRNGMLQKALAEYEKVAAKFPDTTYARTARERIAAVKRELGEKP